MIEDLKRRGTEDERFSVLIIDDDTDARDMLQHLLVQDGFHVYVAVTQEAGMTMARELCPDIIILDVMMSEMEGWVLLAELKSDSDVEHIPVIVTTVLEDRDIGIALGAADYLFKPVDSQQLLRSLNFCLRTPDGVTQVQQASILVIEDDADMRMLLRLILEREGYRIVEAEDGIQGLERVAEQRPALILLDLMLPRMGGLEFISGLRATSAWRSIPILVVTAKPLTYADRERLKGSVARVLQKGVYKRDELMAEIRELLLSSIYQRRADEGYERS
jgi:CheY-like chemotaxis protein